MSKRTVVLVGGPDSGKTNYMARLWASLAEGNGAVSALTTPKNIKYVEDAITHLHGGSFAPRTDQNLEASRGSLTLSLASDADDGAMELVIPDVSGEIWKAAVESGEIPSEWMSILESAEGALLFVRVLSDQNVSPLDWINSAELMEVLGDDFEGYPTQVVLCEMVRFLEEKLSQPANGQAPRLAVVVTAWDLIDQQQASAGPRAYLAKEYPLFIGMLDHLEGVDVAIFGVSIVGGDLKADDAFRENFLETEFESTGYVVAEHQDALHTASDLALPIAWAAGAA
jgi:hypothetical protein